jgi:hypothetical protein
MTDLESRVIDFVARRRGVNRSRLNLRTTLYGDLQLFGDDTDVFFLEFSKEFDVSLADLDLSIYFPPEPYFGSAIVRATLRRFFLSSEPHEVVAVTPLTIGDLHSWAEGRRATGLASRTR